MTLDRDVTTVLARHPRAAGYFHRGYVEVRESVDGPLLGQGLTEADAWRDAAGRVEEQRQRAQRTGGAR